ncbi:MAG: hypothetical protein BGO14_08040 [Chlamydiales bacterium 38-26]|nr:hypothetical protein [Chlamydiales bacterium]OJV10944.1 MAG: hypothetical protein BGO14_08040 [Chlamydiales bacterium 38-26]
MTCEVTIGTFNILDPVFAERHKQPQGLNSQGRSNWDSRGPRLITCIKNSNLDVICLQEVSEVSKKYFEKFTQDTYVILWSKHQSRHDGVAILYKKDKFKHIAFKKFPSEGLCASYVDLQEKASKSVIRVASCHLLGGPAKGPVHSGKIQVDKYVSEVEKQESSQSYTLEAKIFAGDFNEANLQSEKFQALKGYYATDGSSMITEPDKNRKIDWIWVNSRGFLNQLKVVQEDNLSDHRLLATKLTLPIQNSDVPPNQSQPTDGSKIKRHPSSKTIKPLQSSVWQRFKAFFLNIFKAIADLFNRKR